LLRRSSILWIICSYHWYCCSVFTQLSTFTSLSRLCCHLLWRCSIAIRLVAGVVVRLFL